MTTAMKIKPSTDIDIMAPNSRSLQPSAISFGLSGLPVEWLVADSFFFQYQYGLTFDKGLLMTRACQCQGFADDRFLTSTYFLTVVYPFSLAGAFTPFSFSAPRAAGQCSCTIGPGLPLRQWSCWDLERLPLALAIATIFENYAQNGGS
jgi:hypothetical protein